jgi:radical SAM protein with 4Fe4S-binding SPASM domain
MVAFGIRDIILSGGEPLMRPDWLRIASYARFRGLSVSISTNGTRVTKAIALKIAELQADVQVSLDGATPGVHDYLRRSPGTWEQALAGVRNFVAAGVTVTIGTTVTRANIHQIPALCDLSRGLGAQMFRIIPFVPFGRGGSWRKLEVSPRAMAQVTEYLRQRRRQNDIDIAEMEFECTFDPPPLQPAEPQSGIGCGGAQAYFTITETGEVLPCHFFAGVEAEKVLEHDLAWIWEHSRFLNYFRSMTAGDLTGSCKKCDWLASCLGSCRAANFAHGNLFRGNYHCWMDTMSMYRRKE